MSLSPHGCTNAMALLVQPYICHADSLVVECHTYTVYHPIHDTWQFMLKDQISGTRTISVATHISKVPCFSISCGEAIPLANHLGCYARYKAKSGTAASALQAAISRTWSRWGKRFGNFLLGGLISKNGWCSFVLLDLLVFLGCS